MFHPIPRPKSHPENLSHARSRSSALSKPQWSHRAILAALMVFFASHSLLAQTSTANASDPTPTLESVHQHLEFLVGTWTGEGLGGETEEIWLPAKGGQMMGFFRLVEGGTLRFSEILSIGEFDGKIELRLKHFDPQLHGWETKDEVVTFPLSASKPGRVAFGGLVFIQNGDNKLRIELELHRNGKAKAEVFTFDRTPR